jgi:hypothetical protein
MARAIALFASTFSPLASASNLGELGTTPKPQQLHIAAPDVTFSSSYFFSLSAASTVSAQATNLVWLVGPQTILDIADFTLGIYANTGTTALASAAPTGAIAQLGEFLLAAGDYRFDVRGLTLGTGGGAYALSAIATPAFPEPPLPAIAEPSTLMLLGCGVLVVGLVERRRRAGTSTASATPSLT